MTMARKITKEIYEYIKQKTAEGYTPKEINALLWDKYKVKVGDTTIYRIKHGQYPKPKE